MQFWRGAARLDVAEAMPPDTRAIVEQLKKLSPYPLLGADESHIYSSHTTRFPRRWHLIAPAEKLAAALRFGNCSLSA